MNIANSASVSAAVNSVSNSDLGTVQGAASTMVLKKALDVQAQGAIALLNALPQQPALATQGSVGRNVNTLACGTLLLLGAPATAARAGQAAALRRLRLTGSL